MTSTSSSANPGQGKRGQFYGRRLGRPLSLARKKALDALMPRLGIKEECLSEDASLTPSSLFDKAYKNYILEIGFGDGDRLAQHMTRAPDTGFIGVEPYINGMSAFLKTIEKHPQNVCVLMEDAMLLARSLADGSIDALYILNPDPWHKARHFKRRIVNHKNLDHFARILKPGHRLYLSTDVPDLAEWMITQTVNHGAFTWLAETAEDWKTPPKDWITTTYETKGAKGAKQMVYLIFEKNLAKPQN